MGSTEGSGRGPLSVAGGKGCHMVWDPPFLAACFLWFLSAGRPVGPGGAKGIDGAERDRAARQADNLVTFLCFIFMIQMVEKHSFYGH